MSHCLFHWLVEHAAWLLTVRTIQSDGITAYKRLRGRNFNIPLLAFGEMCLYKLNKRDVQKQPDGKAGKQILTFGKGTTLSEEELRAWGKRVCRKLDENDGDVEDAQSWIAEQILVDMVS